MFLPAVSTKKKVCRCAEFCRERAGTHHIMMPARCLSCLSHKKRSAVWKTLSQRPMERSPQTFLYHSELVNSFSSGKVKCYSQTNLFSRGLGGVREGRCHHYRRQAERGKKMPEVLEQMSGRASVSDIQGSGICSADLSTLKGLNQFLIVPF